MPVALDPLKKSLIASQWCGVFDERRNAHCESYTGFLCADIDHLSSEEVAELRPRLEQDEHVHSVFISPTGHGLKPVFSVSGRAEDHTGNYYAVEKYVREQYGREIDPACKNIERLCFSSFDPDCKWNPDAVPLAPVNGEIKNVNVKKSAKPAPAEAASADSEPDLDLRAEIAEKQLGPIDWQDNATGFCTCPGIDKHTTGDGKRDCRVTIDGAPTVFCFHSSCKKAVDEANRKLRRASSEAEQRVQKIIILPSGDVSISECARRIFEASTGLYMRGNAVVELVREDGIARLELVSAEAFRTRAERLGTLMGWRAGRDGNAVLKHTKMASDDAKAMLSSLDARELLPPVASVVRCPIIVEDTGRVL